MLVRVLLFGVLRDVVCSGSDTVELPTDATVSMLLDHYSRLVPGRSGIWSALAVAVNEQYANSGHVLREGDEVALLPPVSGGVDGHAPRVSHVALIRKAIDADSLVAALKRGEDGAVVVFDGIVRNHTRGRRTLYLHYESYETMALAQMRQLAQQAMERFGVSGITLVHRLGRLEIGETSVLIAVASAHRAQAFDACRWLIDTLKKTVPIWKKEHFEDGAVWADGEPFPDEIAAHAKEETA
jgi:molybdopterin synthase catalytic subunit/molybdopterin converting factor small subunit